METAFVLFGVWEEKDFPRIVGVFKTKAGMEAEVEYNKTTETPYLKMWHREFGVKD